ncbi:MAG TPA: serine hydrolase domain-containing protein [Syntrophomonadaceae bacterium]|nr:serine hydrolase domain-containing protein [Syntrophomonadaceae bacterium]HPR92757.1 serine hydrolase domain-containing protein [Syntrophomonadaceae bacterium]
MFKRTKYLTLVGFLIAFIFTLSTTAAFADNIQDTSLESFFDNTMKSKMEKYHIPNAAVSVVKDGEIVYKKGFGQADIEKNIPVDPDTTLFRIGSTSKLITWTAVMQLVEDGKLDLNTDINKYLDFEISPQLEKPLRNANTGPITMTHLMTHTPGFEDYAEKLFRLSEEELLPLNEYVKKYQPARIFPAGEVAAYSNYGTALAGYMVERVSGIPFSDYVEKNIFTPLNMNNSTYRQPPTLDPPAHIAKPYRFINGSYTEAGFEYIMLEPAGSMSSTAADMANFMIAHLSGGAGNGGRILREETVKEMHEQHFTYDPALGGMTLGFMEGVFNGQEVLFHGGSTMLYNSGLYLIPEENTGIFISCSGGNHLLHTEIFQEFLDLYYPITATIKAVPGEGSRERAEGFTGEYQMNRKSVTTEEKILSILAGGIINVNVNVNEEGYLLVTHGGEINKFVEIEPGMYQNLREGRTQDSLGQFQKIIFKTDPLGRIMLTTDGPMTYSKAPFYSTMSFTALAAVSIMLIIIISLIYWIIRMITGLFKKGKNKNSGFYAIASWVGIFTSVTVLLLFSTFFSSGVDPLYLLPKEAYTTIVNPPLHDILPTLLWIFSGLLVSFTAFAWWKGLWSRISRVHYSVFTLAVIALMWMLNYWNLLS